MDAISGRDLPCALLCSNDRLRTTSHPVSSTVLVTTFIDDEVLAPLAPDTRIIRGRERTKPLTRAEVLAQAPECAAILCQNELDIDRELLACAPRLRIVATATAGFDRMQAPAMIEVGVWGTNCPDAFAVATADHAMALLLALAKRVLPADAYIRSRQWPRDGWTPGRWDGITLEGRTLGIVGYGKIGRQVAQRAKAFDMRVIHCGSRSTREDGSTPLPELLAEADVISIHCPLTPGTRHLIDARAIARMKRGSILLNLSRGPVVDEQALVEALRNGRLGGAGLDVFEREPEVSEALLAMDNVVLTPHVGGGTRESKQAAWSLCAQNVRLVLDGGRPKTPVVTPQAH